MKFITMQVNSSYSLLNSTIKIKEYVELGKKLGYEALALTDQGVLHGAVEFYQECIKQQMKPIIGCQFLLPGIIDSQKKTTVLIYAKDATGYRALMELSTLYQQEPIRMKTFKEVMQTYRAHIKVLHSPLASEWELLVKEQRYQEIPTFIAAYQTAFPAIEQAWGIRKEWIEYGSYQRILEQLPQGTLLIPHAICHYLRTEDDYSWRVLKAIHQQEQISIHQVEVTGPYYLHEANAITRSMNTAHHQLMDHLAVFVTDLTIDIPLHQTLLPKFPLPDDEDDAQHYLRKQCYLGLEKRHVASDSKYIERLEHELAVIHKMGFDDYFLIVWDIIAYAHQQRIQTGSGRGSAAGSLVAYALSITQVDPIQYHLLFERFLNPERYTMPDIDLDFPDNKREMILQYVLKRYGREHVAQIATFGTLAAKQALRDVGRVMGISTVEANQWSRAVPNQLGIKLSDAFTQSTALQELVQRSSKNQLLFDTAKRIEGLPRHISTHAAVGSY